MSNSSILGGQTSPARPSGHDVDALGPSNSSDSGSDVQGERAMTVESDEGEAWGALPVDGASDSDAGGTGQRGSATGNDPREGADILPDRIVTIGDVAADDVQDADPDASIEDLVGEDDAGDIEKP